MTAPRLAPALAAALLVGACAPRPLTPLASDPRPFGPAWSAPLHRDHPLVGRILDVEGRRWVDQATLDAALAAADVAVLGEVHDNPDAHLLQAREIRALAAAGKRPVLAFEMINPTQQEAVDALLATGTATADAVGETLEWPKTTWPPFAMYRPVFEAGLAARLPFVAANLSRPVARELMKKGLDALPEAVHAWVARAPAPSPAELAALRDEMARDHCGEMDDGMLELLVLMQRARDAQLAYLTNARADGRGAILVAGDGHARNDRAVPSWLAREAPARKVVAVAHLEVQPGLRHPDDYAADYGGRLPFDYVIFTPAAEREDPCAKLHLQLEAKKKAAAAQAPRPQGP